MGKVTCLLEKMLPLAYEVSVLTARGHDGESVVYPIAENVHRDGILFTTTVPGPNVSDDCAARRSRRRRPSWPNWATSACCASNSSC
jgi:5-(carboxyamino)imidazole ribonucleotide synthase